MSSVPPPPPPPHQPPPTHQQPPPPTSAVPPPLSSAVPPPPPPGWGTAPGASWRPQPVAPKRSGLALASMICGLAGLVLCFLVVPSIVAVVLGLVAAGQIKRSAGALAGLGAARVGWITGLAGLAFAATFFTAAAMGAFDDDGDVAVFDLDAGDCVELDEIGDEESDVDTLPVVDCDEPHDGVVVLTGELNPDDDLPYPSDDDLFDEIGRRCVEDAGVPRDSLLPIAPDERAWDVAGGPFVCIRAR